VTDRNVRAARTTENLTKFQAGSSGGAVFLREIQKKKGKPTPAFQVVLQMTGNGF
jgi:hypothetical protein